MAENIIILIFRRASYFLSINDSLKLLCLNHFFLQHLPNNEYCSYISKSAARTIANLNENDPKLLDNFAKFLECNPFNSYTDLYNTIRFSQNLIKNPCGELKSKYWGKLKQYNECAVQEWNDYKHKKNIIFAIRWEWGYLKQFANIPYSENKKFCIIGAYIRKSDPLIRLEIVIRDKNWYAAGVFNFDIEPESELYFFKYKFEIKPNYRAVEITYKSNDLLYWDEQHFRARFNCCYARIFNSPIIS